MPFNQSMMSRIFCHFKIVRKNFVQKQTEIFKVFLRRIDSPTAPPKTNVRILTLKKHCKLRHKLTRFCDFRDNRKSTESSNSSDTDDSNPLNLKTSGKRVGKHLNSSKRRKV